MLEYLLLHWWKLISSGGKKGIAITGIPRAYLDDFVFS